MGFAELSATYERDHQPEWSGERARRARDALARAAPLVPDRDVRRLRARLAGPAFLLHAGDCAETFRDNTRRSVAKRVSLLNTMADAIGSRSGRPVVTVGRIAGQYAKPRSAPTEHRAGLTLPSYFGDAVNRAAFTADARTPDPWNLVRAREEAERTLSCLEGTGIYTSHEALLLDYEQPQTRRSAIEGRLYDHSAHLLWIGERTRSLTGPHIGLAAGIANPVAVKIGPAATPAVLTGLHAVLNPDNVPGRLTFIFRMGRHRAYDLVYAMLSRIVAEGWHDRVVCDPMHGNTVVSPAGVKTRVVTAVGDEVRAFFGACHDTGVTPGGIHLEISGDDVTECATTHVDDAHLAVNYRSACDPRLNPEQASHLAQLVGELLLPHQGFGPRREMAMSGC
ncbi:3-deoxy-7-phosphoheptulonate synthase [Streptomyces sp. NPDC086993]|uniref:3-deoxy-7-phosphoheptulonate synthase n=1 Tax=Streptomyces sp. NPDC086993 TaxID=3365765 RepID=UPI0037F754A4